MPLTNARDPADVAVNHSVLADMMITVSHGSQQNVLLLGDVYQVAVAGQRRVQVVLCNLKPVTI